MPRRQRPRISRGHPAVDHGRNQKNNSGNDGHVVQQIERAAYDGSGHVAGREKSAQKSDGSFDECKKDQSAEPDHERQQHEKTQKRHEWNYSCAIEHFSRIVIPAAWEQAELHSAVRGGAPSPHDRELHGHRNALHDLAQHLLGLLGFFQGGSVKRTYYYAMGEDRYD